MAEDSEHNPESPVVNTELGEKILHQYINKVIQDISLSFHQHGVDKKTIYSIVKELNNLYSFRGIRLKHTAQSPLRLNQFAWKNVSKLKDLNLKDIDGTVKCKYTKSLKLENERYPVFNTKSMTIVAAINKDGKASKITSDEKKKLFLRGYTVVNKGFSHYQNGTLDCEEAHEDDEEDYNDRDHI
eukprot:TRINITY_DN8120_c0_g1_i1.p1 TRINITY_DN8120_c0_g1~~TRINITY_DN8120_c0_g1_i1.p1  ORF type:complete len:185 (-),score=32.77 TRINITY_DN8120_c0_g1_i1:45-599(-)